MTAEDARLLRGPVAWILGDSAPLSVGLSAVPWTSPWLPAKLIDSMLRGVAQVCFANNSLSGLLVLVGLFVSSTTVGTAGLLCALIATATGKILNQPEGVVSSGLCVYSSVLVGTVTAALHPIFISEGSMGAVQWPYMLIASFFCVLMGMALTTLLTPLSLPVFTLPFNVTAAILFVVLKTAMAEEDGNQKAGNVTVENPEIHHVPEFAWTEVLHGSLLSAGQVYAVQDTLGSVLILLGLFFYSPVLTVASYLGGLIGTLLALVMAGPNQYPAIIAGVWGYNGFLSAGCAVFFLELSWKSILLVGLNTVSATAIQVILIPVFSANSLPVFTMPFCLSSLLLLLTTSHEGLGVRRVRMLTYPEEHLWRSLRKPRQESPEKVLPSSSSDSHPLQE